MEFTFNSYGQLIESIRENGYVLSNYSMYKNYEKVVIIKHDIDMSVEKALEFAKFENDLGIRSTYNVLLCSDFYNLYSKKNMGYIKEIKALGHDIGLHFDETRYEKKVLENIRFEIDILEKMIGEKICSISMHRPSKETLEANMVIDGGQIINTYSEEFFKQFKYISDSRKNWREDPISIVKCGKYNKIHILTHPIWYNEKEETISTVLKSFLDKSVSERYSAMTENIRDLCDIFTLEK